MDKKLKLKKNRMILCNMIFLLWQNLIDKMLKYSKNKINRKENTSSNRIGIR